MPVVFFGHGSPMNTLDRNQYTEAWRRLGNSISADEPSVSISDTISRLRSEKLISSGS